MSRSPRSRKTKIWLTLGGLLLVLVILIILRAPSQAQSALRRGDAAADPARALVWYQVAATLDPHNHQVLMKLAASDLLNNHDRDALIAATRAAIHGGGPAALILQSQAQLEENHPSDAIKTAQAALQESTNDQTAQLQLGLSYAAAGDDGSLGQMIGLLGDAGAAQTLDRVRPNHLALAQELYASGLLNSSERILEKYQVENSEYYLLKARLALQLNRNKRGLEQGRALLQKGIALSPERIDLRQLLVSVDQKLNQNAEAREQGSKIQALQAGKV